MRKYQGELLNFNSSNKKNDMTELANALEQLRELKGWNQQEMADAISMSRSAYSDRIAGRRNFTMANLRLAAKKTETELIVVFVNKKYFIKKKKK